MKLDQFKKAAKRYSASISVPLNEAQEQMATWFGFKNFDAARKSMEQGSKPPLTKDVSDISEWTSNATEESIVQRFKDLSPELTDENRTWFERGFNLLSAVVKALCFLRDTKNKNLSMETLVECIKLKKVEELYLIGYKEFKSSGTWPEAFLRVKSYLEEGGCPGYQTSKLLKKNSIIDKDARSILGQVSELGEFEQDVNVHENHAYRLSMLTPALTAMGAIKNEEERHRFLGLTASVETFRGANHEISHRSKKQKFWCGLNLSEFKLLCHFLKTTNMAKKNGYLSFHESGIDLCDCLVAVLPLIDPKEQSCTSLEAHLKLDGVEKIHNTILELPRTLTTSRFLRYLDDLPGYSMKFLKPFDKADCENPFSTKKTDHDKVLAIEHHKSRIKALREVLLNDLEQIEAAGSLHKPFEKPDQTLSQFLENFTLTERAPDAFAYRAFNEHFVGYEVSSIFAKN